MRLVDDYDDVASVAGDANVDDAVSQLPPGAKEPKLDAATVDAALYLLPK